MMPVDQDVVLDARGLDKHFGGLYAIKNLSFTLTRGRTTALIGPNGAGKTTIFNLITGVLTPDAGAIDYLGGSVTGLRSDQVADAGIGRTFQDLKLFGKLTCIENVLAAFPGQRGERLFATVFLRRSVQHDERQHRERAREILEFVGLHHKSDDLAQDLGYAEAKMLALARVLALDAPLLLLDEPCSGLDHAALDKVRQVLATITSQGRTVCLIEHNMALVRDVADWGIFLEEGALVASDEISALLDDERMRRRYLGLGE